MLPNIPFARRLLDWFEIHRRDLPWRRTSDPWAIWVSEVMLQQTRVEAVRVRYTEFLGQYRTPAAFANVTDDELLSAWQGLGYYRRARLLRLGAQVVAERHQGEVPTDLGALGALPGIGAYTRGAIASIAFGLPEIAVDGNVERVIARHAGITTNIKRQPAVGQIRAIARRLQDPERPGAFNQALMELGATVCMPAVAACDRCPVVADCVAFASGASRQLPVLPARRRPIEIETRVLLSTQSRTGMAVARRIAAGEVNGGQIELPGPGVLEPCDSDRALAEALRSRFGLRVRVGPRAGQVRHAITHHRITVIAHWGEIDGRLRQPLLHAEPGDRALPWTTISRKLFEKLRLSGPSASRESDERG